MKVRTRDGILGAARMVSLQWAVSPGAAFVYVAEQANAVDPDTEPGRFHAHRLAAEAAENALVALWAAHLDTRLDMVGGVR